MEHKIRTSAVQLQIYWIKHDINIRSRISLVLIISEMLSFQICHLENLSRSRSTVLEVTPFEGKYYEIFTVKFSETFTSTFTMVQRQI